MTNSKKTKRALLSSVISLILCLSMLVGTTFAWFTDSVTSGNNKIVAGNLDIELEYLVDGAWEKVTETTNVFEEGTLWEPGHTEVVSLKVSNLGTLALKYQLGINIANEITSLSVLTDADGNHLPLILSEHLEYGVILGETSYTNDDAGRKAAREDVENAAKLNSAYTQNGVLYAKQDVPAGGVTEQYVTLVVYMPEETGNEANYLTGEVAPEIDLGVNLMATQFTYEEDTFGPNYDADAKYDAIPGATFRVMAKAPTVELSNLATLTGTDEMVTLDTAYEFVTTQTAAEAEEMEYANWNADFVVSFDKSVAADSIALGGYYESWCAANNNNEWLAFANEGMPIAAGEEFRLLKDTADIMVNYTELCSLVQSFKCGAADLTGKNAGTTMTVELRMYETYTDTINGILSSNWETGEYVTVGSYSYTFQNDETVPSVTPVEVTVENEEILIVDITDTSNYAEQTMTLDAAYSFTAPDTAETVVNSAYKDWEADWFVSIDQVVEEGLYLAGNYGTWGWIGFEVPAGQQYTEFGLMTETYGAWTYEQIATDVGTFICGVADTEGNNAGATITVELRLTNPEDATDYYVISRTEMPL